MRLESGTLTTTFYPQESLIVRDLTSKRIHVMIHYEVYEKGNSGGRRFPQARFKHIEHANRFCRLLNDREWSEVIHYVCSINTDKGDARDIFKVYCK